MQFRIVINGFVFPLSASSSGKLLKGVLNSNKSKIENCLSIEYVIRTSPFWRIMRFPVLLKRLRYASSSTRKSRFCLDESRKMF